MRQEERTMSKPFDACELYLHTRCCEEHYNLQQAGPALLAACQLALEGLLCGPHAGSFHDEGNCYGCQIKAKLEAAITAAEGRAG